MMKKSKLEVQGIDIIIYNKNDQDYISLTDIARYKDISSTDDIIKTG